MATKITRPQPPVSALSRLFEAKQGKFKTNPRMTNLLCDFAEHDHKRIAQLLQAWLEKDQQNREKK